LALGSKSALIFGFPEIVKPGVVSCALAVLYISQIIPTQIYLAFCMNVPAQSCCIGIIQDEIILTGPTPGPDGEESEIEVII
jgi:hypothetical protein